MWNLLRQYMNDPFIDRDLQNSGRDNTARRLSSDGYCQMPDGSIHPYDSMGPFYGTVYGDTGGASGGQAAMGQAASSTAMPTAPKPGGVAGGGRSGPLTSPASRHLRGVTGRARLGGLEPITGTPSIGGSMARALPYLGMGLSLLDLHDLANAPYCAPVYDPNRVY